VVWLESILTASQYQRTLGNGFDLSGWIPEYAAIDCCGAEELDWGSIRGSRNNFDWNGSRPFPGFSCLSPGLLSPLHHPAGGPSPAFGAWDSNYDSRSEVLTVSAITAIGEVSRIPSYYRARYDNPSTGRFLSEEPMGFAGGHNFYACADDSPLNFNDPFRFCPATPGQR